MYRQGDVLIRPIDEEQYKEIANDGEEVSRENKRLILAYGEATGHAHAIDDQAAKMYEKEGKRVLKLVHNASLVHEEHSTHNLPAGFYEVIRQKEYSPERIRYVAD